MFAPFFALTEFVSQKKVSAKSLPEIVWPEVMLPEMAVMPFAEIKAATALQAATVPAQNPTAWIQVCCFHFHKISGILTYAKYCRDV